ncbi:MAG TPA: hypothetical protein VG407_02725 [Caulobacteraceae bacterium]|nr:hypothetical protein [Caulobacteraceae bacterium]
MASVFDKGFRVFGAGNGGAPLSPAAFRERYQAVLERAAPDAEVSVASDEELVVTCGLNFNIYLGNAYREYLGEPPRLDEIISRHVEAFRTAMVTAQDDLSPDNLVLVIRPAIETPVLAAKAAKNDVVAPDDLPMRRPFAGSLYVYVAERRDGSLRFPPSATIRDVIPDPEEVMSRALQNTKVIQGDIEMRGDDGDLAMLTCEESLGGSLALTDELWALPQMRALGDHPVIGLMRNVTIAANAANPEAVNAVRQFLDSCSGDVNYLTDELFVRRTDGWAVLGN